MTAGQEAERDFLYISDILKRQGRLDAAEQFIYERLLNNSKFLYL